MGPHTFWSAPLMKGRPHAVPPLDRGLAILASREHMLVPDIAKALLRSEQVIYRILKQAGYGRKLPWTHKWLRRNDAMAIAHYKKSLTQPKPQSKPKGPWPKRKRQLVPGALRASSPSAKTLTASSATTPE